MVFLEWCGANGMNTLYWCIWIVWDGLDTIIKAAGQFEDSEMHRERIRAASDAISAGTICSNQSTIRVSQCAVPALDVAQKHATLHGFSKRRTPMTSHITVHKDQTTELEDVI
jgi:hypothetical protein